MRSPDPEQDPAGLMELTEQPADSDKPEPKPQEKPEDKPDLASENAALKAQLASEKETKEYWKNVADRATQRPTTSRLPTDEGKEEVNDDEEGPDLVEIIASGDKKKIKGALAKLGFVSRDDVERELDTRWSQVETAASVQARHPDVANPNSELHKETLKVIDGLKQQGLGKAPNLLPIAADVAYANLAKTGRIKPAGPEKEETDAERIERIQSQQGPSGDRSRGRNRSEDPQSDELTDSQKFVIQKFGISEDKYKARAKQGVRIAGVPK